jgi:hypothetical protein
MRPTPQRLLLGAAVAVVGLFWNGETPRSARHGLIATAEAVVGRPVTPVSYAGVARRTTVRVATPGVGAVPGGGAGQAGVGYSAGVGVNLGGPVNRVGVR